MLPDYQDILERITEPPKWYDEHGVPRWSEFHPRDQGIYDDTAVFVRIACQACGKEFMVATGESSMDRMRAQLWVRGLKASVSVVNSKVEEEKEDWVTRGNLEEYVKGFHYGDPPRHDGCAGDTMNCEDLEVLQAWHRHQFGEWERVAELEGTMESLLGEGA